jgi:hypothetical protein
MTQGKYVEFSVAQRTDLWRRWKAGQTGGLSFSEVSSHFEPSESCETNVRKRPVLSPSFEFPEFIAVAFIFISFPSPACT